MVSTEREAVKKTIKSRKVENHLSLIASNINNRTITETTYIFSFEVSPIGTLHFNVVLHHGTTASTVFT